MFVGMCVWYMYACIYMHACTETCMYVSVQCCTYMKVFMHSYMPYMTSYAYVYYLLSSAWVAVSCTLECQAFELVLNKELVSVLAERDISEPS